MNRTLGLSIESAASALAFDLQRTMKNTLLEEANSRLDRAIVRLGPIGVFIMTSLCEAYPGAVHVR